MHKSRAVKAGSFLLYVGMFTMKVPDSGHEERMLACSESWTLDGQAGMSKEGDSPDYEYWRRLREHKVRSNRLS